MKTTTSRTETAYLRRAKAFEKHGHYEDAAESMLKAISLRPDKPKSWSRLGDLYRAMSRMDMAIASYKKAVSLKPHDAQIQEALLQTYLEVGKYDEAIKHSKLLIQRWPRSVYTRDVLSVAYLQTGLIDHALRITDELIRLDPADPTNHFKKAVLYQQKGEVGLAVKEFARTLEMAPESSIAEQARQAIASLDSFQLRQIMSIASEDNIFRAKLLRDAETAALEKGFVLSYTGILALRQISFDTPPEGDTPQGYEHYH